MQSGDHRNMKINYGSPFWTLGKEFFSKSDQICTGKHRQVYSGLFILFSFKFGLFSVNSYKFNA